MFHPGDPLGFRVSDRSDRRPRDGFPSSSTGQILIRTSARALEGMQKEAIVEYGATGSCWRLVCDEGPWLNGTDLAPFPLAFFTAGLAASCLAEFIAEAGDRNINVESLSLEQDNFFTMEGSALRGTMVASIKSTEMKFSAVGDTTAAELAGIAEIAVVDRSPAVRCLSSELPSGFMVKINDQPAMTMGVLATMGMDLTDPARLFESVEPESVNSRSEEIIRKLADDEARLATADGAVGLQSEQKRMVHVRTHGRTRADGIKVLTVQCIQPAGSVFEFLSDNSAAVGGQERAPSGLALLSCGVAFCFMTQIGRYAQLAKQQLQGYRIVQATGFCLTGDDKPAAEPVQTLVCLDTDESEKKSHELVRMGEQTCYLHAAYRASTHTNVSFQPHSSL
jgi:uncharacterized OsmC-like protein